MDGDAPFFSIVIPTYRRPERLADCLEALVGLDYPRDRFEVIVVDDGSEAVPEDVVSRFRERLPVALLVQPHAGPAAARNRGAERARGRVLAFTDDDCAPNGDWLKKLEARFAQTPECVVGGRTVNLLPGNPYATASQCLIDYLYSYYNMGSKGARFFASNNLAIPADRFHALGGFDTTFPRAAGEDRELCDRCLHHGYGMIYAADALVYHAHNLTFGSFLRQHFNYGRAARHFRLKREHRGEGAVRLEPLSFYLNLLRHPLSAGEGKRAPWLMLLLLFSQAANALGYFWEKGRRPR
jgi:GT2 family glycosyltransferase